MPIPLKEHSGRAQREAAQAVLKPLRRRARTALYPRLCQASGAARRGGRQRQAPRRLCAAPRLPRSLPVPQLHHGPNPKPRIAASFSVAEIMYHRPDVKKAPTTFKYCAERIRAMLKYFAENRCLPTDTGASNPSRIFDGGFQAKCRAVIIEMELFNKSKEWSARQFHCELVKRLQSDGTLEAGKQISPSHLYAYNICANFVDNAEPW